MTRRNDDVPTWSLGTEESIDPLVQGPLVGDVNVQIVRTTGIVAPRQPTHGVDVCRATLSQLREPILLAPDGIEGGGSVPIPVPGRPASEPRLVHNSHRVVGRHGCAQRPSNLGLESGEAIDPGDR